MSAVGHPGVPGGGATAAQSTAALPPVSTLLRVRGGSSGHPTNSTGSSSLSPPCSPKTPAGAPLHEPDFVRGPRSTSPSLASLGSLVSAEQASGKRRPPPPPLTLQPLSSLAKPRLGRAASDDRFSIRSLLNGSDTEGGPRTARSKPMSSPPPARSAAEADRERERFAYLPPPPPTAPGRRTEYFASQPSPPATAPAHADYHAHQPHYGDYARRHSLHPSEYYPPPPPHSHYARGYPTGPSHYHPPPPYDHGTVFYPPPGVAAYDPMGGLGARAPISRTTKACDACRARKVRCDAGGYPSAQGPCSRCRESGRTCVYTATQKKRGPCPGRPSRVASSGSGSNDSATGGVIAAARRASLEPRQGPEREHQAWQGQARNGLRSAPAQPVEAWPWAPGASPSRYHHQQQQHHHHHHPYRRDSYGSDKQRVGGWDSAPRGGHDGGSEHSPRHMPPGYEHHYGGGSGAWAAAPRHYAERSSAHRRRSMSPPPHRF